jgi:3-carboxy-cis,cis-muconate cycloisomerase
LANELELPLPDLPWHAERDRTATVAAALGMTAGAMQKIAGDVVLLAQTEVGEVAEAAAPGKGGSSSMPHKRNPVDATASIAASRLALALASTVMSGMAQEHERGIGGWQAEWAAIPELFGYTAGAVARARRMLDGLEVNVERMRTNLDASVGTAMADSLVSVSDPASYLGSADAFIGRALATYRRATSEP